MEYRFSDRVSNLKPSAIREIFKYAADPSVVSLSAGNPSPDAFPSKEIAEISAKVLAEDPISVLQYSVSEGYTPLRKHLTEYMKKEHTQAPTMTTFSSQQAHSRLWIYAQRLL